MDGYETTENLKGDPETAGIPVIALTASHVLSQDHQRAVDIGCSAYLRKPVARVLLLETVRKHIRK